MIPAHPEVTEVLELRLVAGAEERVAVQAAADYTVMAILQVKAGLAEMMV